MVNQKVNDFQKELPYSDYSIALAWGLKAQNCLFISFFSDGKEMYGSKENFLDSKANILEIEFLAARRALKF